jgi:hypothetical protein
VLGFVLVTGVTAALTLPAVAITAQVGLTSMLPADTAAYVTADLNPTQSTLDQLTALGSNVSHRAQWFDLVKPLAGLSAGRNQNCLRATANKAAGSMPNLGHDTALVLLPARARKHLRRRRDGLGLTDAFAGNVAIVAPLDVHMTLPDALGGVSFSYPKHHFKFFGTTVYREAVLACDRAHGQIPAAYYAAISKGYIILGLRAGTVEEIIRTGQGHRKSLDSIAAARAAVAGLPSGQLGTFYINSAELNRSRAVLRQIARRRLLPGHVIAMLMHAGVSAGSVSVESDGLRLTIVQGTVPFGSSWNPKSSPADLAWAFNGSHQARPGITMHGKAWAKRWFDPTVLTPSARVMTRLERRLGLRTAMIRGATPALFAGQERSRQQVFALLASLNAHSMSQWPGTLGGTAPSPLYERSSWLIESPLWSTSAPGYRAIWFVDLKNNRSELRRVLSWLPSPSDGFVGHTLGLSLQTVRQLSGSLQSDPAGGTMVLTVEFNLSRTG